VCEGTIELATAQREMASNWIAAYRRYFTTSAPLRDYDTAPLTSLDREFILAELEELGISTLAVARSNGPALMAMLLNARTRPQSAPPQVGVEFALLRRFP
jgi:hypothetical protein